MVVHLEESAKLFFAAVWLKEEQRGAGRTGHRSKIQKPEGWNLKPESGMHAPLTAKDAKHTD